VLQVAIKPLGAVVCLIKLTVGGYGGVTLQQFPWRCANWKTLKKDEIDLHRFVLFFGHRFNDWISFKSEFELEHALAKGDGTSKGEGR